MKKSIKLRIIEVGVKSGKMVNDEVLQIETLVLLIYLVE